MFGTLGGPEVILILVVALIVFGPRRLPEIGKSMGKMLAEFRKASNDFKRTIEDELEAEKMKETLTAATSGTDAPVVLAASPPSGVPELAPEPAPEPASAPVVGTIVEPVSHDLAAAPVVAPAETPPRIAPPPEPVVSRGLPADEK